jgi:hypothetical protein
MSRGERAYFSSHVRVLLGVSLCVFTSSLWVDSKVQSYRGVKNIYANSIPKCGTHLLTKCIELLIKRPLRELPTDLVAPDKLPPQEHHEFFATHVPYSAAAAATFKRYNFKTSLIYRDPRDKVVSEVYWMYKGGWNQLNADNPLRLMPFNKLLEYYIAKVQDEYSAYLPWLRDSGCCAVSFEKLIGPHGGGSREAQMREMRKIARHIRAPLSPRLLKRCSGQLFGGTPTFRAGKIGSWKHHFNRKHKQLFKRYAGQLLIDLGYEKDLRW